MTKTRVVFPAVLIAALALGCQSRSNEAARELLYDYLENAMSVQGPASRKIMVLDELQGRARSLMGQTPENFYDRYQRLIDNTRLSIQPKLDDGARQQLVAYIQSVTGSPPARTDNLRAEIQSLTGAPPKFDMDLTVSAAFAFSEEVLRLDMLLDGETNHEKARKKLAEEIRSRRK